MISSPASVKISSIGSEGQGPHETTQSAQGVVQNARDVEVQLLGSRGGRGGVCALALARSKGGI